MFDKRQQRRTGVALGVGYVALILAAGVGSVGGIVLATVSVAVTEYIAFRSCDKLIGFLGGIGLPTATRQFVRDVCVAATVLVAVDTTLVGAASVAAGLLAAHGVALGKGAAAVLVTRRHCLPVEVHNLDLPGLRLPRPPVTWAMGFSRSQILNLNLAMVPAAVLADIGDTVVPVVAASGVCAVAGAVVGGAIVPGLLRTVRMPDAGTVIAEVGRRLAERGVTVALYQSGDPQSLYQLRMWIEPVISAGEPMVVIVRHRRTMAAVADLPCPVVCVPQATHLMCLPLPTVRAALYPSNAGPNIHLLREPGMRHVFIGHGDSDKAASVNPFSKVYDEVWVAGPAGRERYRRAAVGVRDDDVVEVGRPQLGAIVAGSPGTPVTGRPVTVLYAPTWEGWGEDPHHTSLTGMGGRIIEALLAVPSVRIIYKPHPLTGTQSGRAARAHHAVVDRLVRAGALTSHAGAGTGADAGAVFRMVSRHVGGVLSWLFVPNDRRAETATEEPPTTQIVDENTSLVLSNASDTTTHEVVTGSAPTLHDCVNRADLLISDVSSVVADWVASGKPYVVTNAAGRSDPEFRQAFPTAGAAFLLGPDCRGLDRIVAMVAAGTDPLAQARRALRLDLLGPDEPDARSRFTAEVRRVAAGLPPGRPGDPPATVGAVGDRLVAQAGAPRSTAPRSTVEIPPRRSSGR